jgi:hypothetical protein
MFSQAQVPPPMNLPKTSKALPNLDFQRLCIHEDISREVKRGKATVLYLKKISKACYSTKFNKNL